MRRYLIATEDSKSLDDLIATVTAKMNEYGPEHEEYPDLMEKLERLHALKADNRPKLLSRDTIFMGLCQLAGVLIIVLAEKDTVLSRNGLAHNGRTR